ncbi:MAG TPA: T9SS type A sorting domain-containing protein, partial [Rhodothermales bacterium]|nr:T9SS type A sorting domain-containing protein [Rhodothermales bacterium]
TTPLAIDDAYTTFGNTRVQVTSAAQGLLANDYDPDNGAATPGTGLTVKPGSVVRTGGTVTGTGTLSANADGTFTYLPPRGSLGTETFTYILTDADNGDSPVPGVVTFTVGTAVVWYIDNAAAAGGDGRSSTPYNSIADYNTAQGSGGASNPEAGDFVFVATGGSAYTGSLVLLNNQRLIGQGVSLQTELGVAPGVGVTLPAAGTAPTLTSAANTVTLAQNNTIRGLTLGNATGLDLTGTGFGTLTLTAVTLNGNGRPLLLTNGTLAATFLSISSSAASGGAGISLNQVAGSMTVTGGTTITGSTTQGIFVNQSTASVDFGNTSITGGTDAVSLQNNTAGTRTFGTFSTNNNTGVGFLHAVGGGTTTVTGAASILNSGGAGIDIRSSTTAVTFGAVNVASSAGTAVNLGAAASGNSGAVTFGDLDLSPDAGQRAFHALNNTGTITTTSGTWTASGGASTVEIVGVSAASRTPLAMALDAVSSTNDTAAGVSFNFVSGAVSFAGAVSITNPTGAGLQVQNSTATFAFNGAFTSTQSGGTGVLLNTNSGTIGFNSASTFQVTPDANATALSIQASSAAVSSTTGTLTTTDAPALDVSSSALNLTLATVTADNQGDPDVGINLNTASGTVTVNAGTITGGTGTAVNVNAGSVNATIRATVTQNSAARVVDVQNPTGGTVAFNTGTITGGASSLGVRVSGLAAGSSVTFANLNLGTVGSPMAATAVTLTNNAGNVGLGTVSVFTTSGGSGILGTGSSGSISTASGTVSAGAAAAVSITGPAGLTPLDMALTTVSASGGANGIYLQNTGTTGSPGGFRVLGTGSAGSGGTIAGITGADGATSGNGVYLNNTRRVSLTRMNFTGSQNNGVFGTGVRGVLAMDNLVFSGNHGTSNSGDFDESAVNLVDAGGAITLKNSTLNGGAWNAARVENLTTSPTLDSLVFANNTVTTMQGSTVDVRSTALLVALYGGTADVRIRQNTVSYWWGNAIHVLAQQTANVTARITGNTAHQTSGALAAAGGIWVAGGTLTYRIANNSVRGTDGTAISADRTAAGTTMQGTIENNLVGASGVANSGSNTGIGIFASHHGTQTTTVRIANNVLRQLNGSANGAITALSGDAAAYGGSGTLNATIVGNNIQESGTTVNNAQHGILVTHGTQSGPPNDTDTGCYDIGGTTAALRNVITSFNMASVATSQNRIRINQRFGTTSRWPGYTGAATGGTSTTDIGTYLLGRNTASNTANANTSTGGFLNTSPAGSACPQPAPLSFTAQADVPSEPTNPVLDEAPALLGSLVAPAPVEASKVEAASVVAPLAAAEMAPAVDVMQTAAYSPAPPVGGPRAVADPVLLASADRLESVRLAVEAFEVRRAAEEATAPVAPRDPSAVTPVYAYTSEGDTIIAYVNEFGGMTFPIGTLPAGRSVTVTFDVDIDSPFGAGTASVSSQGTVTADGGISVATDDPDVAGTTNPTVTPVVDRRTVPTSLTGTAPEGADAGWRYLSAPVTGVTLANMAAQNLVQGVPGYYDGPVDCNGVPCLSNFRTGWNGTAWPVPSGGAQQLLPGRGFIWYLYDLTFNPGGASQSVALPSSLTATGVIAAGPVAVPLHTVGVDPGKWNLVGNPYPNPLDVSGVTSWAQGGTLNSAVLQTWDPVPGSYVLTTTQGNVVQVWQAAFLENSTATTLSIPATAQTTGALLPAGTPTPEGATAGTTPVEAGATARAEADEAAARAAPEPVQSRLVAFELAGTDAMTNAATRDRASVVTFRSDATDGADLWDAGKLSPPMAAYALLAFGAERPGPDGPEAVLRAQESRPFEPTATVELPVHVLARGTSPTLTLTWPTMENVPEGWALVLRDLETGQDVNLREQQSYTFVVTPGARGEARPDDIRSARAEGDARFTLIIAPSGVVAAGDGPLPRVFALTGVYPNPARGAATVAFDVPRAATVTVEVFDVLGRRVATLAEGSQAPGRHTIRLDGGLLSTGTYLVRMRASSDDGAETYERARAVTIIR